MKTKNKIISIFMCLCLAVLPGCSQDGGKDPAVIPANTPAANTSSAENRPATVTTEGNAADTSSGSDITVTTEEEKAPVDDRFAYCDMLREEYDRYGRMYLIYQNDAVQVINDKIIFYENNSIQVYDIAKKQMNKKINFGNSSVFFVDIDDGYFYNGVSNSTSDDSYYFSIYKYDINGNVLSQIDNIERKINDLMHFEYGYAKTLADGTVFSESSDGKIYMYLPDGKTKKELPAIKIDVGHGLTEDFTNYREYYYDVVGKYDNKLYVILKREFNMYYDCYRINTDTMTYEKMDIDIDITEMSSITGRYIFLRSSSGNKIFDMEKGGIVDNITLGGIINDQLCKLCGIGDIDYQYGKLFRYRFPSDGSSETETLREITIECENGATITPVNEEYYLYKDKYGYFLRTYEGGEDGEIAIMMFEN